MLEIPELQVEGTQISPTWRQNARKLISQGQDRFSPITFLPGQMIQSASLPTATPVSPRSHFPLTSWLPLQQLSSLSASSV
ncbi:hypothetical protein LEMLEM_LOCUS23596 [Lemmus lemmus]